MTHHSSGSIPSSIHFLVLVLLVQVGYTASQLLVLPSKALHFVAARLACDETLDTLITGLKELLRLVDVQVRMDAFLEAEFGDAHRATQPFQYNADLLFGGKLTAGPMPDLTNGVFGWTARRSLTHD